MTILSESGFDRVKRIAAGRWGTIIGDLYPTAIGEALRKPGRTRCACPIHGSSKGAKADGFRLFDDFGQTGGGVCNTCGEFPTGIDLICFLEGQSGKPKVALDILERYLGLSRRTGSKPRTLPPPVLQPKAADDPDAVGRRIALLASIWSGTVPLTDLPEDHQAIRYFTDTRGIADRTLIRSQRHIRFDADHWFARSGSEGHPPMRFPALISMMHGASGQAVGLHKIYLDETDPVKAPVDTPKKVLRRLEKTLNGAVRITGRGPFTHHANVCEGIENGLSIAHATGHPVYAAGYATLLAHWMPPQGVRCVTIWCDRDENKAGINHATVLKDRMTRMGLAARILLPRHLADSSDEDWNDVLRTGGHAALAEAYSGRSTRTITT